MLQVPGVGIDLMWHTHMMLPEMYAKDTLALAGRILDHNDSLDTNQLENHLEYPFA